VTGKTLKAGFAKAAVTPTKTDVYLCGYANRTKGAEGVHDDLHVRVAAFQLADVPLIICALEMLSVSDSTAAAVKDMVGRRLGIDGSYLLVCTTHTHSGPRDSEGENWDRPLAELVADAVAEAWARRQPVKMACGYGFLYGISVNRRWLDRPIDPAVGVIRVDDLEGRTVGLLTNFGLHGVVMGPDNYLISGDWPGAACRKLEQALDGAVCMMTQGGSGDVNPLTRSVTEKLRAGYPVEAIGKVSHYYGSPSDAMAWNIGDRTGGTFEEVDEIGEVFCDEVLRVYRGLAPTLGWESMWIERVTIDGKRGDDEAVGDELPSEDRALPSWAENDRIDVPVAVIGIQGDQSLVMVTEPGEVFAETAVEMRRKAIQMGYDWAWLVGYAETNRFYLPPPGAFAEGGYEVGLANRVGLSREVQPRIWRSVEPILLRHVPRHSRDVRKP